MVQPLTTRVRFKPQTKQRLIETAITKAIYVMSVLADENPRIIYKLVHL